MVLFVVESSPRTLVMSSISETPSWKRSLDIVRISGPNRAYRLRQELLALQRLFFEEFEHFTHGYGS